MKTLGVLAFFNLLLYFSFFLSLFLFSLFYFILFFTCLSKSFSFKGCVDELIFIGFFFFFFFLVLKKINYVKVKLYTDFALRLSCTRKAQNQS